MPLRHVVLLRFKPGTEPGQVDEIARALRALPGSIPELDDYRVGRDLGLTEGNWEFGIAADFATEDHYRTYRDDPDHQRIIRELIQPLVAERAAVQFAT